MNFLFTPVAGSASSLQGTETLATATAIAAAEEEAARSVSAEILTGTVAVAAATLPDVEPPTV